MFISLTVVIISQCICVLKYHVHIAAVAAKSPQSCLILCNPRDGSPPDFPAPGKTL